MRLISNTIHLLLAAGGLAVPQLFPRSEESDSVPQAVEGEAADAARIRTKTVTVTATATVTVNKCTTTVTVGGDAGAMKPWPSVSPTVSITLPGKSDEAKLPSKPNHEPPPARPADGTTKGRGGSGYKNAVYFTNWGIYDHQTFVQNLTTSDITHLLYAFATLRDDSTIGPSDSWSDVEKHFPESGDSWNDVGNNAYGNIKQIYLAKQKNRQLKAILSIGGWTASQNNGFANKVATDAQRRTFAKSAVALMKDWGFDGLDIDWEYPEAGKQASDFVALLKAIREELDNYASQHAPGYHFLLTIASPADPAKLAKFDIAGTNAYLDAWNLMAYDYAGLWDKTTGHQSALFANTKNTEATKFDTLTAVDAYLAAGIEPSKIILGLPLYGRVFYNSDGLGLSFQNPTADTLQTVLYKDLPKPGAVEEFDPDSDAAYSYDAGTRELVSYDNKKTVDIKMNWIKQQGLGGAMFWEAAGDKSGDESLITTAANKLGSLESGENLLSYPDSIYDNIRNGMGAAPV